MPKSQVYGLGRNRKHRPLKSKFHASAANVNMKGKKSRLMGCNCCVCIDLRAQELYKIHRKEMRDQFS